jgi:hypothetical protein
MKKINYEKKSVSLILAKKEFIDTKSNGVSMDNMIIEFSSRYRESITKPIYCPYIISKI